MSSWKDTVMSHDIMMAEIWDLGFGLEGAEGRPPTQKERFERIAQTQAGISFKLGYEQALKDNGLDTTTSSVV